MGGTFMALPTEYRDFFIRNLHDALSGHRSQSVDEAVRSVMKIFLFQLKFYFQGIYRKIH